jgi:hypothetical protein
MPVYQYCWRSQQEVWMLTESEWEQLDPLLREYVQNLKDYRLQKGASQEEAVRQGFDKAALDLYQEITGVREANIMTLWQRRASLFGPPCGECGKPLRTPQARLCAACGAFRELP